MSVTVYELKDSQSGSIANDSEGSQVVSVQLHFIAGQLDGFNAVWEYMNDYCPPYIQDEYTALWYVRQTMDIQGVGNRYWDVTAKYQTMVGKEDEFPSEEGNFVPGSLAWDTTGGTEHITTALSERRTAGATNYGGAINVTDNGPQGCERVVPSLTYTETWMMDAETATDATFVGNVFRLTGTVNADPFRMFAPGEALFIGARAQWQGDQPYVAVTFEFQCRPNRTVYEWFENLGPLFKKGWEFMWIRYTPTLPPGAGPQIIPTPEALYIDRIYEEQGWANLRITGLDPPSAKRKPLRRLTKKEIDELPPLVPGN